MGGGEHPGSRQRRCGGSRERAARRERGKGTAAGPLGQPAWTERRACRAWRAPCLPAWWTAAPGKSRGCPPRSLAAPLQPRRRAPARGPPPLSPGGAPPGARVSADSWAGSGGRPVSAPHSSPPRPRGPRAELAPLDAKRTEGRSRAGSPLLPPPLSALGRGLPGCQLSGRRTPLPSLAFCLPDGAPTFLRS